MSKNTESVGASKGEETGLLPCPFCGEPAELEQGEIKPKRWYVGCGKCVFYFVSAGLNALEDVTKQWNNRVSDAGLSIKHWPHCSRHISHEVLCLDCKTIYVKWKSACEYPGVKEIEGLNRIPLNQRALPSTSLTSLQG